MECRSVVWYLWKIIECNLRQQLLAILKKKCWRFDVITGWCVRKSCLPILWTLMVQCSRSRGETSWCWWWMTVDAVAMQVASRRVVIISAVIMVIGSLIGKWMAVLIMIPEPVIGGLFVVLCGELWLTASLGTTLTSCIDETCSHSLTATYNINRHVELMR